MNALEIRGLSKKLGGKSKTAGAFYLENIDLTLPSGCIMGLVGENGAGKSTTIKLILDMLRRDSGSVLIFGRDITNNGSELKEDIGVVLDEVGIPDCLTSGQVGKIMRNTYKNWSDEAYAGYLKKLSIPPDKQFREYSRGMMMKLGIAIAMSHDPKLLILDEATSGLDPVVRDEVVQMLADFTRDENHSVLVSSHIVSDLEKVCDYIAFLHNGKLLLCEEKDRLLDEYGMIRCSDEQLRELDPAAVKYIKQTFYGNEAIILRNGIPSNMIVSPISIEELFVYMVKEER